MLIPLALALLSAAPAQDTTRGSVRGLVQSDQSGLPVPSATVELVSGARTLTTLADSTGQYAIRRVPAGRHLLRVRHLEHVPLELQVLVPPGGEVVLDLRLEHRPVALQPVTVRGSERGAADDSVAARRPDLAMVDVRAMEAGSGVAGSGLAGGSGSGQAGFDPPDPQDVLFVRGSAADLKLVLLDGAPVMAPFHTGGLIETFETEVLRSARLHLGGAPARFDGGLSYVMDLGTRAGNAERHATSGSVDVVSARGIAEGPLGSRATYLLSGRAIHGASLAGLEQAPFPYDYADGLGRFDVRLDSVSSVGLTLFANGEGVLLDTVAADNSARWSNAAGSFRYRGLLVGSPGELTVAYSRFAAEVPWYRRETVTLHGETRRVRVGLDLNGGAGPVRVRYGLSYDRSMVEHRATDDLKAWREIVNNRLTGDVGGAYFDGTWPTSRRLSLRGGMRFDMFSSGPPVVLSPRLSASWALGDRAMLTLAGGRYHQFVRVHVPTPGVTAKTVADSVALPNELAVAGANHLSLALDQELVEGVRLGLEGYYKRYEGLPATTEESAYNSGLDVWVRHTAGSWSGWMGYSLTWLWSYSGGGGAPAPPEPATGADRFKGRQLLSAGISGDVGKLGRVGVRVAYGAGLPFATIGESLSAQSPGSVSEPDVEGDGGFMAVDDRQQLGTDASTPFDSPTAGDYLRVDAEVSRTWRPRIGARRTELTPYLRVLNALDRRDGVFYRYDPDGAGGASPVGSLPILPVFGVQWRF